jgi:S1-C subfamily serine protease
MGVELAMRADAEDVARGARIERVQAGSPAEQAGLRAGDIITAINGRSVLEPLPDEDIDEDESPPAARVLMLMRDVNPGDTVRVDYLRGGERRRAEVVARDALAFGIAAWPRPEDMERVRAHMRELREALPGRLEALPRRAEVFAFGWGAEARFGIQVADLNPELGEYFNTRDGVLVVRVDEDSPLGLRAGDVIQRVGGRKVEDAAHLRQILASYRRDETVQLEVLRKGQRTTLEARAP